MPAIRQMLIVCIAFMGAAPAIAQEASESPSIQAMRYSAKELNWLWTKVSVLMY